MKEVIKVDNLSKCFKKRTGGYGLSLKETLANFFRSEPGDLFWALKDLSFTINSNEVVGLVGSNGAGKSTLLKTLNKILRATKGDVSIKGKVGAIHELGAGFHQELTGRENILFSGIVLGMSEDWVRENEETIIAFSGIGEFIDRPIKHYSSGMYARLAFSIIVHMDVDIMFIDEILAVGDSAFQRQCIETILKISKSGKTIVLVSHDIGVIRSLCTRVLVLDKGALVCDDETEKALSYYYDRVVNRGQQVNIFSRKDRVGTGNVLLKSVWFETLEGKKIASLKSGQDTYFCFECISSQDMRNLIIAFSVHGIVGEKLFCCDTQVSDREYNAKAGSIIIRCLVKHLPLAKGIYNIMFRVSQYMMPHDHIENCCSFDVESGRFWDSSYIDNRCPVLVDYTWSQISESRGL